MLIKTVALSFVAIILFVMLILRSSMITRTVYKVGFFLGLAVLLASLLPWPGEPQMTWVEVEIGRGQSTYVFAWLLALLPLLPFVVVVETGLSGYRAFSSFFRYAALGLAFLGTLGIVTSILLPRILRR